MTAPLTTVNPSLRPGLRRALPLFLAVFFVYAYFFQGYGYNQNAHFNTTRAIVEHGTFEITPYVADPLGSFYTGDVSFVDGRVYSNKPPGLALLAAPVYVAAVGFERAIGLDAAREEVARVNLYVLTLWTTTLPAALLVAAMFRALRNGGVSEADALILSGGFAFGTILLPYSGIMMVHVAAATCLFVAWMLLGATTQTPARWLAAGTLLAVASVTEYLAIPLLPLFAFAAGKPRWRAMLALLAPPALALVGLAVFHAIRFGSPVATTYTNVNPIFRNEQLFLGHFSWPQPVRLYWLSLHPLRGMLYCSPVLALPLLGMLVKRPGRDALVRHWLGLAVVAYFLLFNLTYDAWTGGFGVGSRFLIPALPFVYLLVPTAWQRLRAIAGVLIAVSVLNMLAVTAVRTQFPTNTFGPPIAENPVAECIKRFTMGQVAKDSGSFNLGLAVGLRGAASVAPAAAVIAGVLTWAIVLRRRERRVGR